MTGAEDFVHRFSAAVRSVELYSPTHPLVQKAATTFSAVCQTMLHGQSPIIVAFIDGEVIVNDYRLPKGNAAMTGLSRDMRARDIEKITFLRDIDLADIRGLVEEFRDHASPRPIADRLLARGVRRIQIGRVAADDEASDGAGLAAARQIYATAMRGAEHVWNEVKSGETPDPANARNIIDNLSKLVSHDRTSLMALTSLRRHDNYTFTHMVNVTALAMALARSLNVEGPLLREFGVAALMHDIGKVHTPPEVLNKPDQLTREEFGIMKRHVVDGAHILRRTPDMPALAPVVAFEHHLKMDLSGYPENVGTRKLNLCTMVVTVVDVFDALRSNRVYREGMATDRIKAIMQQQDGVAFNRALLRRFVNMMGLYPPGTLVRLNTGALGVVTREHPADPFRPQVKLVQDAQGTLFEEAVLANTWEHDERGDFPLAVLEAVDPEGTGIDPLNYLDDGSDRTR